MKKNITGNFFLVGLPGVGKTTLGKLLAEYLSLDFYDSDQYIIEKMGVEIATIFELEGESGFRDREADVLQELSQKNNIVLATGGGIVNREANRILLSQYSCVLYLHAKPEFLAKRLRYDKKRPLLQVDNPLQELNNLYQQRHSLYLSVADIVIDIEESSIRNTLRNILIQLEKK